MKLLLDEPGSREIAEAVAEAGVCATSRLAYVECGTAFARARREGRATGRQLTSMLQALDQAWEDLAVVELDEHVAAAAVRIARDHPVRAADAIHLASALTVASPTSGIVFACFDRRLWDAARAVGMAPFPSEL